EDLELLDDLCFERCEAFIVLRADGDAIDVRDVRPPQGNGLAVLHDALETLADLDGVNARAEQPGEESFHGTLQALFELPDKAHVTSANLRRKRQQYTAGHRPPSPACSSCGTATTSPGRPLSTLPFRRSSRNNRARGGIGRRAGFRFLSWKQGGGSTPPAPT